KVDALLAELRRSVRPWFELRCVAFRGIEAHGPQRLSIERARELLARAARDGQVVFDSQTRCRAEDALCFSLDRRSAYQQDIDCEVAQGVAIHDPKIAVARGGNNIWLHLGVDPFQKGFVLQGMALHGELEKVDSQNLSPIKGSVEVATTRHACATFAVAQEGSGAFFTRVGALDLLVIVERSDGGGTPEVGTATPRFHSMLALRTAAFSRLEYHFDEHSELPSFHLGSGSDAFNVDALMSIVNLDDDSEEQIQLHNGVLVVPANHARKDLVSQVIKTLGQQQLDCFDVELRREVEVGDGSYRLIGEPLHATSLGGKVAFVSDGKLQDYVADFNVEIAQDKGTFDPVLAAVFSGLQVATSVTSLGDECLVDLVVLGRELLEMRRVVEPADGSRSVDLPSVSDTTFA
ncbi:MAG TPA: hypothetical protein PKE00_14095, partial [Planctomycetota bacterium]|nr:hypothetical protein [Planctomycetota bacterium]